MIRFCVRIHHAGLSFSNLLDVTRTAEQLGFDGASLYDVFNPRAIEVWSALTALTVSTDKLVYMPLVLDVGYRHPSMLAKMAAGLDQLGGGGRLILGLGYGGNPANHNAYGFTWQPSVAERVARLEEQVQIMRGLWREPRFSFDGSYFKLVDADGFPTATPGGPPILIASRGPKFGLAGVARTADFANVSFDLSPDEWQGYRAVLAEHLARAGRSEASVGLGHNATVIIRESREEARAAFEEIARSRQLTSEQARHGIDNAFVGTPDDIVQRLRAYVSAGIPLSWVFLLFPDLPSTTSVRLFGEAVLPALRALAV